MNSGNNVAEPPAKVIKPGSGERKGRADASVGVTPPTTCQGPEAS